MKLEPATNLDHAAEVSRNLTKHDPFYRNHRLLNDAFILGNNNSPTRNKGVRSADPYAAAANGDASLRFMEERARAQGVPVEEVHAAYEAGVQANQLKGSTALKQEAFGYANARFRSHRATVDAHNAERKSAAQLNAPVAGGGAGPQDMAQKGQQDGGWTLEPNYAVAYASPTPSSKPSTAVGWYPKNPGGHGISAFEVVWGAPPPAPAGTAPNEASYSSSLASTASSNNNRGLPQRMFASRGISPKNIVPVHSGRFFYNPAGTMTAATAIRLHDLLS